MADSASATAANVPSRKPVNRGADSDEPTTWLIDRTLATGRFGSRFRISWRIGPTSVPGSVELFTTSDIPLIGLPIDLCHCG